MCFLFQIEFSCCSGFSWNRFFIRPCVASGLSSDENSTKKTLKIKPSQTFAKKLKGCVAEVILRNERCFPKNSQARADKKCLIEIDNDAKCYNSLLS